MCRLVLPNVTSGGCHVRVLSTFRASRSLHQLERGVMAAGPLICAAWYYTIVAGFFVLYCPVLYLMFFNHLLYRRVVDVLFALWELYPVALFQFCCGTQLHHYGDYVDPSETTIIVMNHRTRVDWNYVWIGLYHATQKPYVEETCFCKQKLDNVGPAEKTLLDRIAGGKSRIKFVLKDEIKMIPALGWIMQLNYFLFVKRNWQEDQMHLAQFIDYYKRLRYQQRLVLFPEGTDLSEENRRRSDKFATANNLPHFEYVLHPRTTGWAVLCSRLRGSGLVSVYDVTVAYDRPAQTEADLFHGRIPTHVYFHFKRYAIEELPSDESALRDWIKSRWRDKEDSLRKFHKDGTFIDPASNRSPTQRPPRALLAAKIGFIFWTIIDVFFTYALCCSVVFQFWVLYHSLLFVLVTKYFGGFHNIQRRFSGKITLPN